MTLELSLLMPAILSIIIIIIFTGYYYHDRCLLERSAYSACLKCAEKLFLTEYDNAYDTEDLVYDYFEEEIGKRLIGKWDINLTVDNSFDEVSVHVSGNMKCLSGLFSKYLSKAVYRVEIEESAEKMHYEYIYK